MLRPVREAGDVLRAVLADNEDVVLAVSARTRLAFRHREHRFHGHHHAGLQHGVDVLAQFKARFTAIIVRQDTERVAVAEGAVLQHVLFSKEAVDLSRDAGAGRARLGE